MLRIVASSSSSRFNRIRKVSSLSQRYDAVLSCVPSADLPKHQHYLPTPQLYPTLIPRNECDFCTNLIPLYPMPQKSTPNQSIGIRFFTTDSKKPPTNQSSSSEQVPKESNSPSTMTSNSKDTVSSDSVLQEGGNPTIKGLVDSVDTTLKRVSSEWNTGDLMSVYGIIALLVVIVASPIVVR